MKVVIDTNILVSVRIGLLGKPAQIMRQVGLFEFLTSSEIPGETEEVLHRQHIQTRYHLTTQDISTYIDRLREIGTIIQTTTTASIIKDDPDDDKFLARAKEAGADYIVSGDPHLTRLEAYEGIPILTPAQFLKVLKRR